MPKLYQALVKQGDAQIQNINANSQMIMHQSHLPPKATLSFAEVHRAVNDFESQQLKS